MKRENIEVFESASVRIKLLAEELSKKGVEKIEALEEATKKLYPTFSSWDDFSRLRDRNLAEKKIVKKFVKDAIRVKKMKVFWQHLTAYKHPGMALVYIYILVYIEDLDAETYNNWMSYLSERNDEYPGEIFRDYDQPLFMHFVDKAYESLSAVLLTDKRINTVDAWVHIFTGSDLTNSQTLSIVE